MYSGKSTPVLVLYPKDAVEELYIYFTVKYTRMFVLRFQDIP